MSSNLHNLLIFYLILINFASKCTVCHGLTLFTNIDKRRISDTENGERLYDPHQRKNDVRGICGQRRHKSDCADVQSDQGLRSSQTESLDTIKGFNGEQMPGWDFAHVQDDMNPFILRMLEDTFRLTRPYLILLLTLVLLNPDMSCLCKQCSSRSAGFWRSQLIWICTVCH